jgi:6-pyruvoyl-tetrahydropterin synthase
VFTVCVRDHVMIAHSLHGEVFGPAQRRHGATYVIDVEFRRADLDADGIVVDIGAAVSALKAILGDINYRDLDELPAFAGRTTTTEVLARWVFERMRERIAAGRLGAGARAVDGLRVVLHESHVAWAAYEGRLPGAAADAPA